MMSFIGIKKRRKLKTSTCLGDKVLNWRTNSVLSLRNIRKMCRRLPQRPNACNLFVM